MESYWDLYVAYVHKCVADNWANDIDPAHYEMDWNHFLPQCIFGDQPIGHWLTKRQHAIASALQTLCFRKKCMFGWHKRYLPKHLLELAWPYYREASRITGKKQVNSLTLRNKSERYALGIPKTEEHKKKISEALKGRERTEEHCKNISSAKKGFKHSIESRNKMSRQRKGLPKSEEHKIKIGQGRKGKTQSEETKRKISESQKRRLALRKLNEQHSSNTN